MALALDRPTTKHYHEWRERVKDMWLQVRLVQACCGGQLATYETRLEKLNGCLGEDHNCALLRAVLVAEPLTSRARTAQCLRTIRKYQSDLRLEARVLAADVHGEKPRRFRRWVQRLWRLATPADQPADGTAAWLRAA